MGILSGKTALVTGGSRGIGRAVALELSSLGAKIGIVYTSNDEKAAEVKAQIEENGAEAVLIKVDLCHDDCADIIEQALPCVDILIHNASIQVRNKWEDITREEFEKQMNCNFRSVLLINQKYVSHMREKQWGRIITVGSVQERKPHPDMLIYSSAKCALSAMTRAIAPELAAYGITANSVAPGIVVTDRNTKALSDDAYREASLKKVPAGKFAWPSDISGLIAFLCTDQAQYITGQNIFVDGGMGL